jgi:ComF family protein
MASLLAARFVDLDWPLPDALVPVPASSDRVFSRGYNHRLLLAKEMGRLLECSVWALLKRESGGFRQSTLTFERRNALDPSRFKLTRPASIEGKKLLLIDDVAVTGATLRICGDILLRGGAAGVYGLTFSRFLHD